MKNNHSKAFAVLLIVFTGACDPKEAAEAPVSSPAPAPVAVSIEQAVTSSVPPSSVSAGPAAVNPAPLDLAVAERPVNAQGQTMSDLEFLNHLVQEVNESRISDVEIPQKAFKTEAEQVAYEEAMQKRKELVRDLNELVTTGILKALPQAPAGQRYAIDPATGKVVLQ